MHRLLNVLLYTFDKHVNYTIVKKYVYMGGNIYIYMYHTPEPPGVPGAFHTIPPASLGNIYLIRGLWFTLRSPAVIPWGPWPVSLARGRGSARAEVL